MDPKKAERIATNRQDARAALEDARRLKAVEDPQNLDDPIVQEKIMRPEGVIVEIGSEKVQLFPLSGATARKLVGLANQVFASAAGPGNPSLRISGALVENYLDRFIPLLAESTFKSPADVSNAERMKMISHIDTISSSVKGAFDLSAAFTAMLDINGVMDFFGKLGKEKLQDPETKTS